jgi:N-methylhydantoinase B
VVHEAPGAFGGQPGACGAFVDVRTGDELPRKQLVRLAPDAHVRLSFPGGGGYGHPMERPVEAVLSDVVNGYITRDAARATYGVHIDYVGREDALVRPPEAYRVDIARTTELRASERG